MENVLYWLQLHFALGGTSAAGSLIKAFPSAEALFSVAPQTRVKAGEISAAGGEKLLLALSYERQAKETAAQCRQFGWAILTPESSCYPAGFRLLPDPPLALFAAGDTDVLVSPDLAAVVGTRTPSDAALRAAYDLSSVLSSCGIVTVSGGAMGVDSAAHEGALSGRGATVAVLGSGVGHGYLPERVFLRRRIRKRGVLISELPPFAGPTRNTFPRRNRLIAALGRSVTVMESGVSGGSMITANYANKYGKKVFVLSDAICASPGCQALAAEGAAALESTGPVTSFYGFPDAEDVPFLSGAPLPRVLTPEKLSLEEYAVLNGVTAAEAKPLFDELLSHGPRTVPKGPHGKPAAPKPEAPAASSDLFRQPAAVSAVPAATGAASELKMKIAAAQGLAEREKLVFLALEEEPVGLDAVALKTGLPAASVMTALTLLELKGLAVGLPGNRARIQL